MITADIVGERARITPDKTALVYVPTGERFTYQELNERAIRCARLWTDVCGLKQGDRVAILAQNSVEFLDAFLAAAKSGVILVPLSTRYTPNEIEYILRDSGARALHYEEEFSENIRALKRMVRVRHWIALGEPPAGVPPGHLSYKSCVIALSSAGWQPPECDPEDTHCLFYTSGTTGKPRGVVTPHRMIAWNAYNTVLNWEVRADDVSSIFTPLYHAGGLCTLLVPTLAAGGTAVLHRGFDAAEIWRAVEKEKCTLAVGVPTAWKMLADAPEFETVDLNHVRWFLCGGAPLPVPLIGIYQQRGVVFKQGYGLTEVGVNCFAMTAEDAAAKAGSLGKPVMFTEVRLVDAEGRDVPRGEVGELWFRGPHVCRGYWHNPEATAAALDKKGWFRTGDQALCDEDGYYYVVGRTIDMFISGGVNVYPAEVERELEQHPGIQETAVIGVHHPTWGEVGVAFIVTRPGQNLTDELLAEFLSERLAKYKIPKEFFFVEALPRNAYGKIAKAELREKYETVKAAGAGIV